MTSEQLFAEIQNFSIDGVERILLGGIKPTIAHVDALGKVSKEHKEEGKILVARGILKCLCLYNNELIAYYNKLSYREGSGYVVDFYGEEVGSRVCNDCVEYLRRDDGWSYCHTCKHCMCLGCIQMCASCHNMQCISHIVMWRKDWYCTECFKKNPVMNQ